MLIGEFARTAGVTPSRVRFYEARGLLCGAVRLDNGYRHYGPDDLKMIGLIDRARQFGSLTRGDQALNEPPLRRTPGEGQSDPDPRSQARPNRGAPLRGESAPRSAPRSIGEVGGV